MSDLKPFTLKFHVDGCDDELHMTVNASSYEFADKLGDALAANMGTIQVYDHTSHSYRDKPFNCYADTE